MYDMIYAFFTQCLYEYEGRCICCIVEFNFSCSIGIKYTRKKTRIANEPQRAAGSFSLQVPHSEDNTVSLGFKKLNRFG